MTDTPLPSRPMLLEEFTPLIGRSFSAECDPKSVDITLVEAYALRDSGAALRPPFMLIFHTPPEYMLGDGIYIMRCGKWGPDQISIGSALPPTQAMPGFYYQAVFN
jgi:hypothetical protein